MGKGTKVSGMASRTGRPKVPKGHETGGRNLSVGIKLHKIVDVRKVRSPVVSKNWPGWERDDEKLDVEVWNAP